MANKKKSTKKPTKKPIRWPSFRLFKREDMDFKPDAETSTWIKTIRMTQQQRQRLTKWGLYILSIILSLVVQDVVMSRISIFGATTDLAVSVIVLIAVMEGTEVGSIFLLIASTLYYFTGSAPGAYSIGLITFLGIGAVIFRQLYWHRSKGSLVLCASIAVMSYEIGLFVVGLISGLTLWSRLGVFLLGGCLSSVAITLLYPLIYKIGLIGGNTWKE